MGTQLMAIKEDRPKGIFARQAIPMVWDFAEINPLGSIGGTFLASTRIVADASEGAPAGCVRGNIKQEDATGALSISVAPVFCTDPPYYANVGYADLADFFYVWLRRSLSTIYPALFTTLLTPKAQELVATPYRFGGDKRKARGFFEEGLGRAFVRMREVSHPNYPLSIFYAFKQAESDATDEALPSFLSEGGEESQTQLLQLRPSERP
jgi:putative DNA methylase